MVLGRLCPENLLIAQHILDQVIEANGRAADTLEARDGVFIELAIVFINEMLRKALHGTKGRPHIVRDGITECLQFTVQFGQFLDVFLELLSLLLYFLGLGEQIDKHPHLGSQDLRHDRSLDVIHSPQSIASG